MADLLRQKIFPVFLLNDPTPITLSAIEVLARSEEIYDFADWHRQSIANTRFCATLIGLTKSNTPKEASERLSKIEMPLSAFQLNDNFIKNKDKNDNDDGEMVIDNPIGSIFENVAAQSKVNFRSGITKAWDDITVICSNCVARSLLLRTMVCPGGGAGNASWPRPMKLVYGTPLGNNLFETFELCRLKGNADKLWWSYNYKDNNKSLIQKVKDQGEILGCSIQPCIHSFDYFKGICYLCGNHGDVSRTVTYSKMTVKTRNEIALCFIDPFVVCSQKTINAVGALEAIITINTGDNIIKNYPSGYGRIIESSVKNAKTKRFRYAYICTDEYSKLTEDFGGEINLDNKQEEFALEKKPYTNYTTSNTNSFINNMLKLNLKDLTLISEKGFCNQQSLMILHKISKNTSLSRLSRQLLLELYAKHPVSGKTIPSVTGSPFTPRGRNALFSEVRKLRREGLEINWYELANIIARKAH